MNLRFVIIYIIFGVFLTGCATYRPPIFLVNVDSIGEVKNNRNYILLPGNKKTKIDNLYFKEYSSYVHRALQSKGFVLANSFQDANVAIFLGYGIGDPEKHRYSYSLPTWGKTGVSSSYTTGTINSLGNTNSYSGTTTYTPTYGITGSTSHIASYDTYFRYMFLDAVNLDEYRRTNKEVLLWKTYVTSSGTSDDLRRVFPILVAASNIYIATNTEQKIQIRLLEDDKQVMVIKDSIKEPVTKKD